MDEPDRNARKEGANRKGLTEVPFSGRALVAGGLLPFALPRASLLRSNVENVLTNNNHDYNSLAYDREYVNRKIVDGGAGTNIFLSIYRFLRTDPGYCLIEFIKRIDNTGSRSTVYFGEDIQILANGQHVCTIDIPNNKDSYTVLGGEKKEYSARYRFRMPTDGKPVHFTYRGVDIPGVPGESIGGSGFDFTIRFPPFSAVQLTVYSGALGYYDFPLRNGRYRLRPAGNPERLLMLAGTGGDASTVTAIRAHVTTYGPVAHKDLPRCDWFLCSADGRDYTLTPVSSLSCVLNNRSGAMDDWAQAFRWDGKDRADRFVVERAASGAFTFRNVMSGGYLTANLTENSNGKTCMFRPRRKNAQGIDDPAQEWWLEQVDERYFTREQIASGIQSFHGPARFQGSSPRSDAMSPSWDAWHQDSAGVLYDPEADGQWDYSGRFMCGIGAYGFEQTLASTNHEKIDPRGVAGFQPYADLPTIISLVNQPKGGKAPIHLMLLDENGNVREVGFTGLLPGEVLRPGDAIFAEAQATIAGAYTDRIAELVDRWYVGKAYAEPGNFAQGNKLGEAGYVVHGPTYVWGRIKVCAFKFYADGVDNENVVHRVIDIPLGSEFRIPAEALRAAVRPRCNLNDRFGEEASTGFTGWFWDPELTRPFADEEAFFPDEPITYRLYGRNRATVRAAYAEDSARPEPGADYRVAPEEDAPAYPHALEIPDLSGEPVHTVQGPDGRDMGLPPIGDNGADHLAAYVGERVELPVPRTVFRRMGDGRWRTYRCTGWSEDPAPRAAAARDGSPFRSARETGAGAGSLRLERDTVRYVRWEETVVDGVVTR